jgi:hypothetical protein
VSVRHETIVLLRLYRDCSSSRTSSGAGDKYSVDGVVEGGDSGDVGGIVEWKDWIADGRRGCSTAGTP